MSHVYTRERHENKNTRFWATYAKTGLFRVTQQVKFCETLVESHHSTSNLIIFQMRILQKVHFTNNA